MTSKLKIDRAFIVYFCAIGFSVLVFLTLLSLNFIGYSVEERCQLAQEKYEGDCVESLIEYLDDESNSFRSRNSAIWALGQMGDARGKQILEKYYTGNIPAKEKYDKTLSQYEMKKALKLVAGGFNITHWVWKRDDIN